MGFFNLFKRKQEPKDISRINIKAMPKHWKGLPTYFGYVVAIKQDKIKGWHRIYMGKTKRKKEKDFLLDEHGLGNITNLLGREFIGYKLRALIEEDTSRGHKEYVIRGWKFS
jgi:hypothetical protein